MPLLRLQHPRLVRPVGGFLLSTYIGTFMGTRLYPKTTDPRKLEQLACVLPGTSDLVPFKKELEKSFLKMREGATCTDQDGNEWPVDAEYEFHSLFRNSDVHRYENFLLFGWGKFDLDLVPDDQDECGGETTDRDLMLDMLLSSSWNLDPREPEEPGVVQIMQLSEGFYWL